MKGVIQFCVKEGGIALLAGSQSGSEHPGGEYFRHSRDTATARHMLRSEPIWLLQTRVLYRSEKQLKLQALIAQLEHFGTALNTVGLCS